MNFIHAKCGAFTRRDEGTLICHKSRGHTSPQCYDSSEDEYFVAEHPPKKEEKKK